MMSDISFAYSVGDIIECRTDNGTWREACVMRLQPYRGKPGYDIAWHPTPKPAHEWSARPSAGGWMYEACMRPMKREP
jgi:hypothetical protein